MQTKRDIVLDKITVEMHHIHNDSWPMMKALGMSIQDFEETFTTDRELIMKLAMNNLKGKIYNAHYKKD